MQAAPCLESDGGEQIVVGERIGCRVGCRGEKEKEAVATADFDAAQVFEQVAPAPVMLLPQRGGALVAKALCNACALDDVGKEQRSLVHADAV